MFDKEAILDLIRQMPDNATVDEVIAALSERKNPEEQTEELEWSADELTADEWRQWVAYGLRDELADSREDVYTEEAGEPSHAPR